METIFGKYAEAKIFTDNLENCAINQIKVILDNYISNGSKISIMPDVHPGKVGPIGLTMTLTDRVIPNLLGVDIGCGMLIAKIKTKGLEFQKLDKVIREAVPSGFDLRKKPHHSADPSILDDLLCLKHVDIDKAMRSLGTLGGGNHFIELDKGKEYTFIVIHSGSRHLGVEVTNHYNRVGGRPDTPYEMTYLTGELMEDYIHDVSVVSSYASLNRKIILEEILKGMKWKLIESYETIHNYIGRLPSGDLIIRKGAASALEGENVIIPINMRDGVILGKGKGNPDWNYSAPHGSGRVLRRDEVKNHYTLSSFKSDMKGIYSSSINADTLDEAPVAYRSIDEITSFVTDSVEIEEIIKPVFNFKAGG